MQPDAVTLLKDYKEASSMDVDVGERLVFWVDAADHVMYRAQLGAYMLTNVRVTLRVGIAAVEGLRVEWINKKVC